MATKSVGAGKAVTLGMLALEDSGSHLAINYTLTGGTHAVAITPKALTLTGFDAANKTYDGNATATILNAGSLSGVIAGDTNSVTVSNTGATFANKNVGAGKTVTLSGVSLAGTDAGNYSIAATATDTANIEKRTLAVTWSGANKVYDRMTDATVTTSDNRVQDDNLAINRSTAFDTHQAAERQGKQAKKVTIQVDVTFRIVPESGCRRPISANHGAELLS